MNGQPRLPKILVSDDEPKVVDAWSRRGRQLGFEVVPDINSEVVELARSHQPALILLDINQSVNGLELLHVLKRDPHTRHIPVMVISALDEEFIKETCREFGAMEFLPKPIDDSVMVRVVELARSRRVDSSPGSSPPAL